MTLRSMSAIVITISLGLAAAVAAPPTDNPVATYYDGADGYPAWTDAIRWSNVIDMSRFDKGVNDFEKFENARDELFAAGGGVLYYPAGTYDFRDAPADGPNGRGLMLRSGVVIRGDAPAGKPNAFKDGKLDLATKFLFAFQKKGGGEVPRDWNFIGLMPESGKRISDVNNVGVCWVNITAASVYFGPDCVWGDTWETAKSWRSVNSKQAWKDRRPDGTHPGDPFCGAPAPSDGGKFVGAGHGRLVFGCAFRDGCVINDYYTCGRKEAPDGFAEDGFHMAKFVARITAYGTRVLVANNYLPRNDGRNFIYEKTTVKTIPGRGNDFKIGETRQSMILWDYNRVGGIDINKELLGLVNQGWHEEGVVVRDNWVYNHGHKGFNVSGKWVTIRDNRNERSYLKGGRELYPGLKDWRLTLDGFIESSPGGGGMISDNLARAFDLGGANIWVDGNTFNNTGSDPGNDGEGILCQAHGGTHVASWAVTNNKHTKEEGENGYIMAWAVKVHGLFIAWNETPGTVGSINGKDDFDCAYVSNKAAGIKGAASALIEPAKTVPAAPAAVAAQVYQGDAVRITWTDAADNEIAFRIERQSDGGEWTTIAYRPPHIQGSEGNPQEWIDFTAPPGRSLTYRVLAVGDIDKAAPSAATKPVTLAKP